MHFLLMFQQMAGWQHVGPSSESLTWMPALGRIQLKQGISNKPFNSKETPGTSKSKIERIIIIVYLQDKLDRGQDHQVSVEQTHWTFDHSRVEASATTQSIQLALWHDRTVFISKCVLKISSARHQVYNICKTLYVTLICNRVKINALHTPKFTIISINPFQEKS